MASPTLDLSPETVKSLHNNPVQHAELLLGMAFAELLAKGSFRLDLNREELKQQTLRLLWVGCLRAGFTVSYLQELHQFVVRLPAGSRHFLNKARVEEVAHEMTELEGISPRLLISPFGVGTNVVYTGEFLEIGEGENATLVWVGTREEGWIRERVTLLAHVNGCSVWIACTPSGVRYSFLETANASA